MPLPRAVKDGGQGERREALHEQIDDGINEIEQGEQPSSPDSVEPLDERFTGEVAEHGSNLLPGEDREA